MSATAAKTTQAAGPPWQPNEIKCNASVLKYANDTIEYSHAPQCFEIILLFAWPF